ncbi:hypothetical protein [Pseudoteredinibacter isoporae]|uniref:Phosphodiesterase n=1 Tax=Pseudoteredinibacter isoporae TaxID=570281 RepID=A0A7X0JSZ8_9GAMM|nr:hypothetical protein [Pseudoteredinibacter isoporae]MBB6521697.1 hypothetical protein [Pseudoteredinibacter isoporae]
MNKSLLIKGMITAVCFASASATSVYSYGEEIRIPVGSQGEANVELPNRGLSSKQLINQFGEPQRIQGPVGTPPISQWHYDGFVVYLEGDYVIHAVRKPKPKADTTSE